MRKNLDDIELLAPAGNWDSLKAAVAAGADAVYLGGKIFNARQSAENFDNDGLAAAADYLHLRGRKMYVTVNTLVKNDEMKEALRYLSFLYRLNVDAVLIQDLGLLSAARKLWPGLEVHASTQMTVTDAAGAVFLKNVGVKRVVLARETSLFEISEIVAETGMETEVFLHGALCISYSGTCLFSSLVGGRSGNRGRCAQPCRLEYRLLQNGREFDLPGTHLLSPGDLCLLPYLNELREAGVKALKIEGRMKAPEYVGTVVRVYRKALDRLLSDPGSYRVVPEETKTLRSVFNRGLTSGYFFNDSGPDLMSINRPSNRGLFAGRVKGYDYSKKLVTVSLEEELRLGDGVEVWVTKGGRLGTIVEDLRVAGKKAETAPAGVEAVFSMPHPALPGDRVFITSSKKLETEVKEMLRNDYPGSRLHCQMKAAVAVGEPLTVTLSDYEGNSVTVSSKDKASPARKHPLTTEVLKEHLTRLGNSPFIVDKFSAAITGEPMLPFGIIHRIRREAAEALKRERLARYKKPPGPGEDKLKQFLKKEKRGAERHGSSFLTVFAVSPEMVKEAVSVGVRKIILGGERQKPGLGWDEEQLKEGVKISRSAGVETVLALPVINRQREKKRVGEYLRLFQELNPDGILVSNIGSLQRVLEETELSVYINYPLHTFNLKAITFLRDYRIKGLTLSPELSKKEIFEFIRDNKTHSLELEILVFGALELMISQFCPIGSWFGGSAPQSCRGYCKSGKFVLKDRKGIEFPVITDEFCRMHLLNSRDLSLIRELPELKDKNLSLRLDLRHYPFETARKILGLYREGLTGDNTRDLWDLVGIVSGRGLTRGHYYRGVE